MNRYIITGPLIIVGAIAAVLITVEGWDNIITHFAGDSLGFWKTYALSIGFGLLRHNPMIVQRKLEEDGDIQILIMAIVAILIDCLAVYVFIPYALS